MKYPRPGPWTHVLIALLVLALIAIAVLFQTQRSGCLKGSVESLFTACERH